MKEFLPLVGKYMETLAHNEEEVRYFLTRQWVPLSVLELTYTSLVNKKEIKPIESLPKEEKERIWKIIKKWIAGSQEHRVRCAKVLYFIEVLQDKKIEGK